MFIGELIEKQNNIKSRIIELRNYLYKLANNTNNSVDIYGEAIGAVFELLDDYQYCVVVIENSNSTNKISLGSNEITINNAIKIRNTLKNKIDCLEDVINGSDFSINTIDLMNQKNKLLDEYSVLNNAVSESDWRTEIKS